MPVDSSAASRPLPGAVSCWATPSSVSILRAVGWYLSMTHKYSMIEVHRAEEEFSYQGIHLDSRRNPAGAVLWFEGRDLSFRFLAAQITCPSYHPAGS